jgi:hypothetical protein
LINCHNRDTTTIEFRSNTMKCGKTILGIPKYKNVQNEIKKLHQQQKGLKLKYTNMYNALINGDKVDKKTYDSIATDVISIDKKLEYILMETYDEASYNVYTELVDRYNTLLDKELELSKKSVYDPSVSQEMASIFKQKIQLEIQLDEFKNTLFYKEYIKDGDYNLKKETQIEEPKVVKKKVVKKPDVKKVQVLTVDEQKVIKDNIKKLLKETYKFKDKTECLSKQRNKPFYTSKDQILEEIEKNPELKQLMPKNYKNLTKEKLCEYFFD